MLFVQAPPQLECSEHTSNILLLLVFLDQDSVRLLAVEACGPLATILTREDTLAFVIPVVQKFAQVLLTYHLPLYLMATAWWSSPQPPPAAPGEEK
jgi:hypothetical protein